MGLGEKLLDDPEPLPQNFVRAYRNLLLAIEEDRIMQALSLQLPSESTILQMLAPFDPEEIYWARLSVKKQLYKVLRFDFERLYKDLTTELGEKSEYSPTIIDSGARQLRQLCLSYMMASESETAIALAEEQYNKATNMSDKYPAMVLLMDHRNKGRETTSRIIQSFYEEYKDDAIGLDKWFAAQARGNHTGLVEKVMELTSHGDFNIKNPNRLRSLIFGLVRNLRHYHRADGLGYKLVADIVIQVDKFNEQVAARMCKAALSDHARYDIKRQTMMKDQLSRIMGESGISNDTYEIVSKALGVVR
eukprot:Selendium_serpulae@DN5739_c0_g1_i1.p1